MEIIEEEVKSISELRLNLLQVSQIEFLEWKWTNPSIGGRLAQISSIPCRIIIVHFRVDP